MNHRKTITLVNGDVSQHLSCYDRGLNFGDGVFETIAVIEGRLLYWDDHMQRLQDGCTRLYIAPPDVAQLKLECQSILQAESRQVIKIIMTRGEGGQGYAYAENQPNTRIVFCKSWPSYNVAKLDGVKVGFSNITMYSHPKLVGIKHLNALEQVMATAECQTQGFDECLRANTRQELIEGCKSNLFWVKNEQLFTPCLSKHGIAGIMRKQVINKATELNIPMKETVIDKDDILQADELFLTNSLIGIWPIINLGEHAFAKGKWTHRFIESLHISTYYS